MDIFNTATIKDLLILAENGENSGNDFSDEPTLTRKLLLAKVLVDRWNNVMTDVLFHESQKDKVLSELEKNIYFSTDGGANIWGAALHFVNNIPEDRSIILALNDDGELTGDVPSRSVSSFEL